MVKRAAASFAGRPAHRRIVSSACTDTEVLRTRHTALNPEGFPEPKVLLRGSAADRHTCTPDTAADSHTCKPDTAHRHSGWEMEELQQLHSTCTRLHLPGRSTDKQYLK